MFHGIGLDLTNAALLGGASIPPWVVNPANAPDLAIDWANNRAWKKAGGLFTPSSLITVSRASSKTDLFPTSASGFAYSTFGNGVALLTSLGMSAEEARTNVLLNSTAPATQTTASLATGTYTLWVNGSGSATSSAGTATITGAGAATNGSPNVFVVTVAGTVAITVSGSLNAFQCELGAFGTSLIVTAGATATRAADVVTLTTPPTFGSAYSMYAKGTPQAPITFGSAQAIMTIDSGLSANRFSIRRSATAGLPSILLGSASVVSVNAAIGGASAWAQGVSGKVASAGAASDQKAAYNGALDSNSYASAMPVGANTVHLGSNASSDLQFNGFLEYSAIWASQRVPNAQLQSMTA